jgi:16S rRNA (guanine1516-N2)-methyltransferase
MGFVVAFSVEFVVDAGAGNKMAVKLVEQEGAIGLAFTDPKKGKPFFVDFLTPTWKRNFSEGLSRNHIFRRALGASSAKPRICDATAGFGTDAVMALSLGCEVVAFERSALVAKVLRDGVNRAARQNMELKLLFARLQLMEGDAIENLATLSPKPDVVYLDPMFDKPKKKSKSPKSMQLLQELLGQPPTKEEEEKLFTAAWSACRSRVVVKRPIKAHALRPNVTHSFKGQSVRYDVYVKP